ncbi:uncharacterized protein V6R79_012208 [Siganus canaliculatus]
MFHESEDEVMAAPGVCCDGSWRWHTLAPGDRMKKLVSHLRWLHIQLLVVLLAGQAFGNETSSDTLQTASRAQGSVQYLVDMTVTVAGEERNVQDIHAWLTQIFQNDTSCLSTIVPSTSVPSTSVPSTSVPLTSVPLTSVPSTSVPSTSVPLTSVPSTFQPTTPARTFETMITMTTATLQTSNGTTAQINPLTSVSEEDRVTSLPAPIGARSGITNSLAAFQVIDLLCLMRSNIRTTDCLMILNLTQQVPPCCILRTLCVASRASSDIQAVGIRANRMRPLQGECFNDTVEDNSCTYSGPVEPSCDLSESAYVAERNSTCDAVEEHNNCSCSAYCSGSEAYYTFTITLEDSSINQSSIIIQIGNQISQSESICSSDNEDECPLFQITPVFKNAIINCSVTASGQICRVILELTQKVPICTVAGAVQTILESQEQIHHDGRVTRAAICGNSVTNMNPLSFSITLQEVNLGPDSFCEAIQESQILNCQNGENVVFLLDESCHRGPFTTSGPNVTTVNTTASGPNVTTVNTTASDSNVTTVNATESPANVTTESPVNTTAATNMTVTPIFNTTANVSVTPSEIPTTTQPAESQANDLLELTRNVSNLNASQIELLVSQLEALLSGPNVSVALGNTSVHIVSNLLEASPETLSSTSNRIIGIVDTVGLKLVLDDQAENLLAPDLAVSVKPVDGTNFQETIFSIVDSADVQVRGPVGIRTSDSSSIPQGSILLPPSLTQNLTSQEQLLASRVQFSFFQRSTVFQDRSLGERRLNSGILGASVANVSITDLQENVTIHLQNLEPVPANFVSTCVFWDFESNDGSGGWNSRGCYVVNRTDNGTVCSCNHLTSFGILLDISREPITSRVQATILTFITYIGCGVSAIFLSITLLTYLAFGKLRKDIPSKILIQLCLSLLLLNLVFLVDAWLALYPDAVGLCISTAWFLHYFLLVAFTWMGLEAVHMYLALVKVFNTYISHYMLKFSLVGWGVPMIVVIIVIAIDENNYGLISYGRFSDGTSDEFCWLKNDVAFYVAVVAYFCVIFLFNLIMFIVVLVQLCRMKRQNPHNSHHRTKLQDARSVAGITILLGLTWGFAFFAWGPVNLPFMYLFAIFNSLQGFFIFVLHCAVKENVRRQWRTYLCCGKMRLAENSEWSRTATQKTAKKSSLSRITSLHSSKSNNSSSSTTYLVSDSSETINGTGNPLADRTITTDEDSNTDVVLNEINKQNRHQHES